MQRSIRWAFTTLVMLAIISLLLSACTTGNRSGIAGEAVAPLNAPGGLAVIYLLQPDSSRLVRHVLQQQSVSAQGLLMLLQDPGEIGGLISPLPDDLTLKVVGLDGKTLTVEIDFHGTPHWGTRREAILFDSIVLTLCELSGVDAVRFAIKGDSYRGRVDLREPFSRQTLLAPQPSYEP